MSNINYSLDFELSDNNFIPNLFGVDDKNIQILEKVNNVQIKYRGNKIKIIGTKSSIKNTKEEILLLFKEAKKGIDIDEDKIMETRSMKILEINPQDQMDLFFQTKKRKISPRTQNQKATSTRLPTVQPCNSARCPTVTSAPMCSGKPPGL